jgi:hypothetical protein
MLIRLLWTLSVRTRVFLRRWMPTNRLLDQLRSRRGLKWGTPAMLLGLAYLAAGAGIAALVQDGWSAWLNLLFFLCLWNGLKFLLFGPVSLVLLARVRIREHRARRRAAPAAA